MPRNGGGTSIGHRRARQVVGFLRSQRVHKSDACALVPSWAGEAASAVVELQLGRFFDQRYRDRRSYSCAAVPASSLVVAQQPHACLRNPACHQKPPEENGRDSVVVAENEDEVSMTFPSTSGFDE